MIRLRIQLALALGVALAAACMRLDSRPDTVPVEVLLRQSPCDVLPENGPIVGTLAHSSGYPRWNGHSVVTNPANPHMKPDTNVIRSLTGARMFANEIHDCQRLVIEADDTLAYGPLVGVLPLHDAMLLGDADFGVDRVVASIYNWGGFHKQPLKYDPLEIQDGRNCLWLRHDASLGWRAALTAHAQGPCFSHTAPSTSLYTLNVQRALHAGPMPATARWEWHEADSVHIIGIKCGSAWCRISPSATVLPQTVQLPAGDPHATIPGYFDEQHLAVPGGSAGIVPGPLAVVTPTDTYFSVSRAQLAELESNSGKDVMSPALASGLDVATIALNDTTQPVPSTYEKAWALDLTPITLRLRMVPGSASSDTSTFYGRGGARGRSVPPIRIDNTLHAPLGAVRWRWHDTASTESLWSACGVKGMDCCDTR